MDLRVTVGFQGRVAVIRLRGELDLHTTPSLRAAVDGALEAGINGLVLDLADLTFLDSHGIGVVVGCFKAARQVGTTLSIRNPTPHIERILSITALDRLLTIEHRAHGVPDASLN